MAWGIDARAVVRALEQHLAQRGTGMSNDPPGVYQPPPGGYPDGAVPWNARLPNAMAVGGAGRPVPRMTLTPMQQAAADLMKQRTGAASTPFRGRWNYAVLPKDQKRVARFADRHPVSKSSVTLGPNGRGYYQTYVAQDGATISVPVHVDRSYSS